MRSRLYPPYVSMLILLSHTNTQGRGRGTSIHTHTNTRHNTHNATSEAEAPPRHRHTRHHQRQQIGKHNTTRHPTEGQGQLKNFQERPWTVNLTHFLGFPYGVSIFIFFWIFYRGFSRYLPQKLTQRRSQYFPYSVTVISFL